MSALGGFRNHHLMSIHTHATRGETRLGQVFILTLTFLVVEVVGGFLANSLALLSDAGHMVIDNSALLLALLAARHGRRPPDRKRTYGYRRLEVLAGLANGILLVIIAVIILREAWLRLNEPAVVKETLMLTVAAGGLVVNLIGLWLLRKDRKHDLNLRAAFLHVAGDALGSVGAIAAAVVIHFTGWMRADAVASVVISGLILWGSIRLIRESLHYLLEGAPREIPVVNVEESLRGFPGVLGIHDLHLWRISSGLDILTAHVVLEDVKKWRDTLNDMQDHLRREFGLYHATLQMEGIEEVQKASHQEGVCDEC